MVDQSRLFDAGDNRNMKKFANLEHCKTQVQWREVAKRAACDICVSNNVLFLPLFCYCMGSLPDLKEPPVG